MNKMMNKKVLFGLTTTPGSDWKGKIEEIRKFNLEEIALFPTFLEIKERKELYALLENTGLERIPHIHLRDDTEFWELEYYTKRFQTEVFNIHAVPQALKLLQFDQYKDKIFVENQEQLDDLYWKALGNSGGFCLDFSHWYDFDQTQHNPQYEKLNEMLDKNVYKIGCCHISAVRETQKEWTHYLTGKIVINYSYHQYNSLNEFDYIKKYVRYFPHYVSIELEDSFERQFAVKKYLEKLIEESTEDK